jgi:hypothetical protein
LYDRELTQLISAAQYYLEAAESLQVPDDELARTVRADSDQWPADRVPHDLSPLDTYSAHLASCAMRLATIQEILVGDAKTARACAYANTENLGADNLKSAATRALEILLRDNVGHAEHDAEGDKRASFRRAALAQLTFKEMGRQLRRRYETLVEILRGAKDA